MDANGWRSIQGSESEADSGDWKSQLLPESREKIALKIMDNLKKCIPHNDGPEGLHELKKLAKKFEEKIFFAATNQTDYLRQISLKMLAMESHKLTVNSMPTDSVVSSSQNPQNSGGSNSMQAQVVNQGQQIPMQIGNTLVQERQQIQNSIMPGGVPGSSGLTSAMSSISGLPSTGMPNVASQNPNVQNIQNMSGVPQNLVGNAMGQRVSSSMPQQQRQIQGRQQITPQQQQQQQKQQSQNQQNHLYQQQQLLMKSKYQQGKISHSVMQSHMQQLAQQHPNLMQSSQQSSVMQSGSLSGLQPNQQISGQQPTQTGMQQNSQPVFRQQQTVQSMQQQQSNAPNMRQQTVQSMQQHQMSNATNMQQNLTGQQNSISDMQQQQQRMLSQQNNLPNMRHQQMSSLNNAVKLPQQSLVTQSGSSNMLTNQHTLQMMQQSKVPIQTQSQHGNTTVFPSLGQPSQQQPSSNQSMAQIQSQTRQLPQQLSMQQKPSSHQSMAQVQSQTGQLQQQLSMQQQPSSQQSMAQIQSQTGQIKQQIGIQHQPTSQQSMAQIQSQTGQLQKQLGVQQQPSSQQSMAQIQSQTGQLQQQLSMQQQQQLSMQQQQQQQLGMQQQQQLGMQQQPNLVQRDMHQRLQASGPLLQQQNKIDPQKQLALSEASSTSLDSTAQKGTANSVDWQEETYQKIRTMKDTYLLDLVEMHQRISDKLQELSQNEHSEKMLLFKTMVERIITLLQIPKCKVLPIYREKLASYEKQIINILASNKLQYKQGSTMPPGQQPGQSQMQSMQQQTHDNQVNAQLQQTGVQNSMSTISQNSMTDQGNHLNNMPAVSVGSLQQNPLSGPQQVNLNALQPNFSSVQSNASMLPSQQILQTQPSKQQLQMQQQLVHRQIQQEQQTQQQQAQFQSQKMSQMNEINDLKTKQQLAPKSGIQRTANQHQQMKPNTSFPISSPQMLQTAASPQVLQQQSPQIDQQYILSSLTRTGTPLQSTNSPLIVPSPSTPFVPSPLQGESEKIDSGVGNIKQSLATGTPGISASPLLESTSQEIHANASAVISGKSNVTELPMDRLIRAVKSMSPSALSDSVSDIGSIVGMFDGIAGSAPGNGSRAAVGEDLAALTKCRLQANKMKRYTTAICNEDSDSDSAATSHVKRPRLTANHSLWEEIREINAQLIDTVVDISDEKLDHTADPAEGGTIVKCSYSAVSLSPTFKSLYASRQMLSIKPLRLLVPQNYPNCSPIFLDKFLTESSKESDDLSVKVQLRFGIHVRTLSQPMSLGEIAKTWDGCSREVIVEYAQQNGGGTFSSKYGSWGNGLSAV